DVLPEHVAASDERQGRRVVVLIHGCRELPAYAAELTGLELELPRELASHVEHAGGGGAQRRVVGEALLDGRLVDGFGIAMLAAPDPASQRTPEQISQAGDDVHADLLQRGSPGYFPASSIVMPSSRIFCWKF